MILKFLKKKMIITKVQQLFWRPTLGPEFRHQNQDYTNNEINADYKKIRKIGLNKMENAGRRGKQ